eukprot:CAMPEP_0170511522 /NCGR_PEP_ID=MMETSP0208-20121228/66354_1 /TAXON_ID=197538 /ORGANISM="Strombidium inclinatum, Strain S3" /LENGTH=74 /DNA_ID=CAMNT_0010795073 /DNA_START=622 /DNA_END=843 /DNA_ORIENTATION=-
MKNAIAQQPVAVWIDAATDQFELYSGGVYNGPCSGNPNHGALAVGYGQDWAGYHYWLVKNSWGSDWGENGYIKL